MLKIIWKFVCFDLIMLEYSKALIPDPGPVEPPALHIYVVSCSKATFQLQAHQTC